MIAERVAAIQTALATICAACGRDPSEVEILAATKDRSPAEINEAIRAGIATIGENRVQEAAHKFPHLLPCRRMFIGHLQRNKVREAIQLFDVIATVDSLRLAEAISTAATAAQTIVEIYLQANLTGEETKSGFHAHELEKVMQHTRSLPGLNLTGLLVIGPHTNDTAAISHIFEQGNTVRIQLDLPHYSAGMSTDWQYAIRTGSTQIRLGTALFGKRE